VSDSPSQLPARPSLEQLRKQAKELLRAYRAGDSAVVERFRAFGPRRAGPSRAKGATLADAQFVLAREYGFESWVKLARHVKAVQGAAPEQFERLANDLVAAYEGDAASLRRVNDLYGRSFTCDELRVQVQKRRNALPSPDRRTTDFALSDAQELIARESGFESWTQLAESAARPAVDPRSAPLGLSAKPPYYRIDWQHNTIEPRPPLSEQDWVTIFGVMKELNISGLNCGPHMIDAALARLAELEHVTRLELGGSDRVTDEGLRHLGRMPQLEQLDLSGYGSPITDRGLEVLRHLKGLRRFKMCWPQRITDAGVAHLSGCDRLESVDLLGTPTGDGAVHALTGKPKLRLFKSGNRVTDAGVARLHEFPVFKTWQGGDTAMNLMAFNPDPNFLLLRGSITDRGVAGLVGLDGLFALNLDDGKLPITAAGLKPLAVLPNLAFLGFDATDETMPYLAALPRLRKLMCQDTNAGDDGFAALSRSQTLEYIWGRRCYNLRGRGFAALAALPALRGLVVSCKNVDDNALSALPSFPALREFMPMDVPDDGFRHVGRCARLERLWCMYCKETGDVATGHIAGLSGLKSYAAFSSRITDVSLEILGRMPSLERLQFEYCAGITNAGLACLAALPRLREVELEGSPGVTRDGFAVLPDRVRVNYQP
jgi:hypothetical protein